VKDRRRKFSTPHISPIRGDGGMKIFVADGALPDPNTSKISDSKMCGGGEMF